MTLGKLQNGIEIDLGLFKNVAVDAAANTMTIGGGVIFDDVFDPLYNAGKEIRSSNPRVEKLKNEDLPTKYFSLQRQVPVNALVCLEQRLEEESGAWEAFTA